MNDDVQLLESGIVDSLGTLDIVNFLEQTFAIKIADEELTPENFACIRQLAKFVNKKKSLVEASAK